MRVGIGMQFSNTEDWGRFEAAERGEDVPGFPAKSDSDVLQEEFRIAELTEELGFDALWCVVHLGTMVTVLPWHHPIRLAEQVQFLQEVMGPDRDLKLGVGRGVGRREYNALGVEMDESRTRFQEVLDIVRLALTTDRFSYPGEIFNIPELELRPHARDGQRIVDNMGCAWGSPESVGIAASNGLKAMIIPQKPLTDYHAELDEYTRLRAEAGYAPSKPTVVVWAYCAPTADAAEEMAKRYLTSYMKSVYLHYEFGGTHFENLKTFSHYAERSAQVRATQSDEVGSYLINDHVWGTPDECITKMQRFITGTNCDEIIIHPIFGGMPLELGEASMRLIAKEMLPAIKQTPLTISA